MEKDQQQNYVFSYYRASTGTMEGSPVFKLMLEVDGEEVSNTWFVRFDDKYTVDLFGKQ